MAFEDKLRRKTFLKYIWKVKISEAKMLKNMRF